MRQYPSRLARITVERRLRRGGRTVLATLALTALGLSAGLAVQPAQAATTGPTLRVMAGDSSLTAVWNQIAGASKYTVKVSEKRSLSHARIMHTTQRTATMKKLRNGHTYYVAVTADRSVIGASAVRSAVVRTAAHRGVPIAVSGVTVTPGALPNQLQVDWKGGDRTLKVGLVAGSNVTVTERRFHSAWYPATTHSITLTVPAQYRTVIGAGTGNPVYVRVVQSNSSSTTFHATYDYADKYRASPVGSWAFAATAPIVGASTRLRVAELNTQTNGSSDRFSAGNQWDARAPRVAKAVNAADADLFLTAELSTNADAKDKDSCHNTTRDPYQCEYLTQYQQLARRLPGLTLADPDAYDRVLDTMRTYGGKFDGGVTDGAHLFYNPSALTLLDHGFFSPALTASQSFENVTGLGVPGWMDTPSIGGDRWLTWAKFQTNDDAHRVFYAVSAHFPVGDSMPVVNQRAEAAKRAEAAISRMAGNLPIVFGGDFNSDTTRNPNPAQTVFMRAGWFDSAAVPDKSLRTNMRYNTVNGSGPQTGADEGYPLRPFLQKWPTSRIDYILLKNSPHTFWYHNVLHVNPDGSFDRSYQGTDHNMQLADIGIGDPAAS